MNFEATAGEFADTGLSDFFYVRWTGRLHLPADGKYTLYTESDDGSRLFIDGKLVVDNGGLHAMEEKSGDVELEAGFHDLKIEFFENEGAAGCRLSYSAPEQAKRGIPARVFFHKKDVELDKSLMT